MTPRSFLAKEIQRAREAKGLSRDALAQEVYVSESLVRAWESGRRAPQPEHLVKVEAALGTNGYLLRMKEELVKNEPAPEYVGRWLEIEEEASSLLWWQPLLIPGLLQTVDYARDVIARSGRQVDDAEQQVQSRLERQRILAPENALVFVAIIDECVLHRPVGGPKAAREQFIKILEIAEQPNVMIQVVPMNVGSYPGLAGGFGIAAMDGQEYAYVDDVFSGDVLEHPQEVATVKRIWETLRTESLSGKQSLELIAEAAERWK